MAITFKSKTNNAAGRLSLVLTAGITTLTLKSGEGALFPASNFRMTVFESDPDVAREIVLCSSRTGDVCTVTRAQEGTSDVTWAVESNVKLMDTVLDWTDIEGGVNGIIAGTTTLDSVTTNGDITVGDDGSGNIVAGAGNTTVGLLDTVATTIDMGGAATTITIGANTGTTTIKHDTAIAGSASIDSGAAAYILELDDSQYAGGAGDKYQFLGGTTRTMDFHGDGTNDLITTRFTGGTAGHSIYVTQGIECFGDSIVGGDLDVTDDMTIDTNTLHVDSVNSRVGIGTISPTHLLQLTGTGEITLKLGSTDTQNPRILFNTSANPLSNTVGASINADRTNAVSAGDTDLVFYTGEGAVLSEKVRIESAGLFHALFDAEIDGDLDATGSIVSLANITAGSGTVTGDSVIANTTFETNGSAKIAALGSSLGFFGASLVSKLTITGSRGGNAALASLLTNLATYGLITDSTTA